MVLAFVLTLAPVVVLVLILVLVLVLVLVWFRSVWSGLVLLCFVRFCSVRLWRALSNSSCQVYLVQLSCFVVVHLLSHWFRLVLSCPVLSCPVPVLIFPLLSYPSHCFVFSVCFLSFFCCPVCSRVLFRCPVAV